MARLMDKEPRYEGEIKVWNSFGSILPQNGVFYNNRSANGHQFDFAFLPEI